LADVPELFKIKIVGESDAALHLQVAGHVLIAAVPVPSEPLFRAP